MSKEANKTLVGAFVIGAIALLVAALLVFGSGRLLHRSERCVAFFDGSVKGLQVGAAVMFRGVEIGEVTDIRVFSDPKTASFRIPVLMEIYPERIDGAGTETKLLARGFLCRLIERGLRAQLQLQSLLTSRLFIQLDFHQDKPAVMCGTEGLGMRADVIEIPTIPSSLEAISQTIQELPLEDIANDIRLTLKGIERFINSPELGDGLKALQQTMIDTRGLVNHVDQHMQHLTAATTATLTDIQKLVERLDAKLEPVSADISRTAESAQALLDEARGLMYTLDRRIVSIEADLQSTTAATRSALGQAESTLASFEGVFDENSAARHSIETFLTELTYAAQSIRSLVDLLERNPDAFLRGKGGTGNPGGN